MSARARGGARSAEGYRLRVNPITCDAHGMCAELLPEQIVLDEWGYPVIGEQPVAPHLMALARQAVQACPTHALMLERRRD